MKRVWLGVLGVVIAAAIGLAAWQWRRWADPDSRSPLRGVEVTVVGTVHSPTLLLGCGYSPGHIRQALSEISPTLVAVESPAEWLAKGEVYRHNYDALVAYSWALDNNVTVVGVDWVGDTSKSWSERERRRRVGELREALEGDRKLSVKFEGAIKWGDEEDATLSYQRVNGAAYGEEQLAWIDKGRQEKGTAAWYMDTRDQKVISNLEAAVRSSPKPVRVAVVIGAAHKADIERKLRAVGATVLRHPNLIAADDCAPDQLMTPRDLVVVLQEALDGGEAAPRARTVRLLAQLGGANSPKWQPWHMYFSARVDAVDGHLRRATSKLRKVCDAGPAMALPFAGHRWFHHVPFRERCRIQLGRQLVQSGDSAEGKKILTSVAGAIRLPAFSEDYRSNYEFLASAVLALRDPANTAAP